MTRLRAAAPLALLLVVSSATALPAQEVLAVVSSGRAPYEAAFDSFAKAIGRPFTAVRLPQRLPAADPRTRVVVAFGSAAAMRSYPESATLIVSLAPGLMGRSTHPGRFVSVSMTPAPAKLVSELRRLQPGLKRLAVLSVGLDTHRYFVNLKRAGAPLGVEVIAASVSAPEGLPDALRTLLAAGADSVWLAPDPRLVTPLTMHTIAQFSWDNHLPFYAPTRSLVSAGAAAAVCIAPEETGRLTAELALRAIAGDELPDLVYPERTRLTVNAESARKSGLVIVPGTLHPGDEVIR